MLAVDQLWDLPGMPTSLELMPTCSSARTRRHDRLEKGLVQGGSSPPALDHAADRMRRIINLVDDRALERNLDGVVDLVQDVGLDVPAMVIGDMLGVPRRRRQAGELDQPHHGVRGPPVSHRPRGTPSNAVMEIFEYVNTMIEHRLARCHRRPHHRPRAGAGDLGEHLAHEDIWMFCCCSWLPATTAPARPSAQACSAAAINPEAIWRMSERAPFA